MTAKPENPVLTPPAERLATSRELELLRDLQRLANERRQAEDEIEAARTGGLDAAVAERDHTAEELEREYQESRTGATSRYEEETAAARKEYEASRDAAQREYKGLRQQVENEHSRVTEAARQEEQQASWETQAVFEAIKGRPKERFLEVVKRLERNSQELAVLEHDATTVMKLRRQWREFPPVVLDEGTCETVAVDLPVSPASNRVEGTSTRGWRTLSDPVEEAIARVERSSHAVRESAEALIKDRLTRILEGGNPFAIVALLSAVAVGIALAILGPSGWRWIVAAAALALVLTGALFAWLAPRARRRSGQLFDQVRVEIAAARKAIEQALSEARLRAQREAQSLVAERDQQLSAASQKLHSVVGEKERWKETEIGRAGQTYPQRLAELRENLDASLSAAKRRHAEALAAATEKRDRRTVENRERFAERRRTLESEHEAAWNALRDRWFGGLRELRSSLEAFDAESARLFPDWNETEYREWALPTEAPSSIRFGQVTLDLATVKNGIPRDERLRPTETTVTLPALMTLEEHPALVITADEEGRRPAVEILQLSMLRLLTAMPPGKVRFTILDPVGLGENFGSFMHLADFDEQLIASRIWTEPKQIDEQLTRLTAHMETVLQKYLRNEFATIAEYNERAGEVAEPFQVLVVANFPANFSESAARKLVSIVTSGPRCGVYTLVSVDRKQRLPNDFDLNDLLAGAVHLDWTRDASPGNGAGRFRWKYPAFQHMALSLDRPPEAERFNEVLRAAGRAAKDSMKVEVPFEVVAPPPGQYWADNCAKELVVPIGRAGAMRLQSVRLGRGTSQHVLVCGKTGSGKSTFLHALVTNIALHYSPDEVEFYLIDFKKGVEFKTYATHRLPHARVIAIESEREFGMSVLERLDEELRRRGDLFRAAGVQDLPDFRAARPEVRMPRVLLVVDEFQELFVEDDKLSQEAALLLDRLVRQGRAFGIHVLLGSQTLSGAYSLPRSTMGQMAVRVALQCSEADAHIILSDERNMAARFLSRPGEAIYNDQNGLLAGNSPFQVVWLSEAKRVEYLAEVEELAAERLEEAGGERPSLPPTIVFEGDQPADPAENIELRAALASPPAVGAGAAQQAWLGAAVAIKSPTAASFARHAGSNLLVVGAWEESAIGVLASAVISLAAQNKPESASDARARFIILDGTRPESTEVGVWQRVAEVLAHDVQVFGIRETSDAMSEIAGELARREESAVDDAPPVYLVIFNGGRFRDLRRNENDFSFSMDADKPASPEKQWAEILRNGPAWGIHTLLWCDSYNNVNRLLDRMMLREFEMRVVFQMSAADSSSLLDTPVASRLRAHRGLFASEDLGTLEKFRPYGPPSEAWLARVRKYLADRG